MWITRERSRETHRRSATRCAPAARKYPDILERITAVYGKTIFDDLAVVGSTNLGLDGGRH
jgi:hypothetical protein